MFVVLKRALPALALLATASAYGQTHFYSYFKDHGASVSVGATGNFITPLTTNATPVTTTGVGGTVTTSNQIQTITSSPGVLTSLQFHPAPWAGVEVNYGYQHYTEQFDYNTTATASRLGESRIKTTTHEATAAYQFHPKHIPFGPSVNVGGGAIDFVPTRGGGTSQWRGTGLVEAGFETNLPYTQKRLALRIQGRGLFYRAPNFNESAISTRSWRVSAEPSASIVYRF